MKTLITAILFLSLTACTTSANLNDSKATVGVGADGKTIECGIVVDGVIRLCETK